MTSQLYRAVDQDDEKWLEQILKDNPDGWKVKNKVELLPCIQNSLEIIFVCM